MKNQRRDVPERGQNDVTIKAQNSPHIILTLWIFVMRYINGLAPVLSIAGPAIRQPKSDSYYVVPITDRTATQNNLKQINKNKNLNHGKENCKKLGLPPKKRYV